MPESAPGKSRLPGFLAGMGLSSRIAVFYGILIAVTLTFSGLFYQKLYSGIMLNKVSSVSMQTLYSVSSNLASLLEKVNEYSKMTLANPSVQDALKSAQGYEDVGNQRRIVEFMQTVMSSSNEITSLYIVDNNGNRFFRDKLPNHFQYFNSDMDSEWRRRADSLRGGSYVVLNGGDAFTKDSPTKFISLIRIVNDLESQKPIGAVLISITEDMLVKAYSDIARNYETRITVLDENARIITSSSGESDPLVAQLLEEAGEQTGITKLFPESGALYSMVVMPEYGWKIVSMIPYGEVRRESRLFMLVTFSSMAAVAVLILTGSIVLAGMITRPIGILVDSMKSVTDGTFREVEIDTSINEFVRLRDGYNLMMNEIRSLLERAVREEKIKRKAEMNVLQEQIKPHFLYNTFDSVSSLALMGRTDDVYRMMSALGSFYRVSLSRGREIITVREELETVKNYLDILKYRYENLFTAEYSIDPVVSEKMIVKLVLQPFVENAVYHGLKPLGSGGRIWIGISAERGRLLLRIEDNGVGMTEERLSSLLAPGGSRESFGVRGTIQRLELYYGERNPVKIESSKGGGTRVTISLPERGPEAGE